MKYDQFKPVTILGSLLLVTAVGCAGMHRNRNASAAPHQVSSATTTDRTDLAGAEAERASGSAVSTEAAKEVRGKTFVEIEFMRDSAELTEQAKSAIRQLVEESRQTGKIKEVIVLAWADEEYPSEAMKKLSKGQVDLANRRSEAVKEYVKMLTTADVDRYNLAKQPNVFSKWFNTTDARLKNALLSAGLPTTADERQYPSKASHSVIIAR